MLGAVTLAALSAGCSSAPRRPPVDRAASMRAMAQQCRAGTATYTITNNLARRVAIYRTGGSSGPSPIFVDYLNPGERLRIDGLPIKIDSSKAQLRFSTVYFFGSDELDGGNRPSPLPQFDQRRVTTSVKCDSVPGAAR